MSTTHAIVTRGSRGVTIRRVTESGIPWKQLRCNGGHHTAEHVPRAVRALFSARFQASRRRAYWRLDNHIITQGFLDESAPYALQLILGEVTRRFPRVPDQVFELLCELSYGESNYAIGAGALAGQSVEKATKDALEPFVPFLRRKLASDPGTDLQETLRDTIANIED